MTNNEKKVVPPPLPTDTAKPPRLPNRKPLNNKYLLIGIPAILILSLGTWYMLSNESGDEISSTLEEIPTQWKNGGNEKKATYTQISNDFNFVIEFTGGDGKGQEIISIYRKHDNSLSQRIVLDVNISGLSTTSRSYATGYMQNAQCIDFDCGDIVVADMNFDGLEDFAIKKECFNSGCAHIAFLQSNQGGFYEDEELTELLVGLPSEFDRRTKSMTIYGMSGCCSTSKTTITYRNGKWSSDYEVEEIEQKGVEANEQLYTMIKLPKGFMCSRQGDWISGLHQIFERGSVQFIGYTLTRDIDYEKSQSEILEQCLEISFATEEVVRKTKDGLYISTGNYNEDGRKWYYYKVLIPQVLYKVSVRSRTNDKEFSDLSTYILEEIRKATETNGEFRLATSSGESCYF